MKAISGKAFSKLLEKRGWVLRKTTGSHHIYTKEGNPARVSVPVHGNTSMKIGLLKHLMNLAGIQEDEL